MAKTIKIRRPNGSTKWVTMQVWRSLQRNSRTREKYTLVAQLQGGKEVAVEEAPAPAPKQEPAKAAAAVADEGKKLAPEKPKPEEKEEEIRTAADEQSHEPEQTVSDLPTNLDDILKEDMQVMYENLTGEEPAKSWTKPQLAKKIKEANKK